MAKLAAICAVLFSCLAFVPASASATPAQPAPPWYTVRLITANGSGCTPSNTAVTQVNTTEFTVTYSNYITQAGKGATFPFHRNCQLNVLVGVPSGWSFGILSVDYRGFSFLESGAKGYLLASYYFQGMPATANQNHSLVGPQNGNYEYTDAAPVMSWSPCHFNGTLNVNTGLTVTAPRTSTTTDEVDMESTDFSASTVFNLGWQPC